MFHREPDSLDPNAGCSSNDDPIHPSIVRRPSCFVLARGGDVSLILIDERLDPLSLPVFSL